MFSSSFATTEHRPADRSGSKRLRAGTEGEEQKVMATEPVPLGFGDFSMTMDASPSSLSSLWPLQQDLHYLPQESVEEVKQKLAAATVELEAAREEVRRKEKCIAGLVELVRRTAEERDQLQRQQQRLLLSSELVVVTSRADSDRSLTSSSPVAVDRSASFEPTSASSAAIEERISAAALDLLATKRPLPQQGQLLQAVIEAGPLLQNLLVVGPLPRWRIPPPAQALPNPTPIISSPSYSCAPMRLPWSID